MVFSGREGMVPVRTLKREVAIKWYSRVVTSATNGFPVIRFIRCDVNVAEATHIVVLTNLGEATNDVSTRWTGVRTLWVEIGLKIYVTDFQV
jgi:hypothetical protein